MEYLLISETPLDISSFWSLLSKNTFHNRHRHRRIKWTVGRHVSLVAPLQTSRFPVKNATIHYSEHSIGKFLISIFAIISVFIRQLQLIYIRHLHLHLHFKIRLKNVAGTYYKNIQKLTFRLFVINFWNKNTTSYCKKS